MIFIISRNYYSFPAVRCEWGKPAESQHSHSNQRGKEEYTTILAKWNKIKWFTSYNNNKWRWEMHQCCTSTKCRHDKSWGDASGMSAVWCGVMRLIQNMDVMVWRFQQAVSAENFVFDVVNVLFVADAIWDELELCWLCSGRPRRYWMFFERHICLTALETCE